MKNLKGFVILSLGLVALSAALYWVHYLVFHDAHHIFIYMVGDIAFVPIEVLMVTLILHRLLEHREKRSRMVKLNMVIGVFFTELGSELLAKFASLDLKREGFGDLFASLRDWDDRKFLQAAGSIGSMKPYVKCTPQELVELNGLISGRKDVLVRLLENPNLLEHETFTELLWAVTHMVEELGARRDLLSIPDTDLAHLNGDLNRAYGILVREWLQYMRHLHANYPYLFSFAVRTNPFDSGAKITIT